MTDNREKIVLFVLRHRSIGCGNKILSFESAYKHDNQFLRSLDNQTKRCHLFVITKFKSKLMSFLKFKIVHCRY